MSDTTNEGRSVSDADEQAAYIAYWRKRAAQEAAIARSTIDRQIQQIHCRMAMAYKKLADGNPPQAIDETVL